MANSNTEHSKKLRAKTASEYNKRLLREGKIKQITLRLHPETAERFNAILSEIGGTKNESVKRLCEIYEMSKI